MSNKRVHIFGGGTFSHIRPHLAISAPAFGSTALALNRLVDDHPLGGTFDIELELTGMALGLPTGILTNDDLAQRIDEVVADPLTKVVFFTCAVCDFEPTFIMGREDAGVDGSYAVSHEVGKNYPKLSSRQDYKLELTPTDKLVRRFRAKRKDIFLVACKTTWEATGDQMYQAGLKLCKTASVNLVLVSDVKRRSGMIVTPEEAAYHETYDREELLTNLVDMALHRSQLSSPPPAPDCDCVDCGGDQPAPDCDCVDCGGDQPAPDCDCVDCGGDQPGHRSTCSYMADLTADLTAEPEPAR